MVRITAKSCDPSFVFSPKPPRISPGNLNRHVTGFGVPRGGEAENDEMGRFGPGQEATTMMMGSYFVATTTTTATTAKIPTTIESTGCG